MMMMMTMMMILIRSPKTGSLVFTPPGDEMSEVVSHYLRNRVEMGQHRDRAGVG